MSFIPILFFFTVPEAIFRSLCTLVGWIEIWWQKHLSIFGGFTMKTMLFSTQCFFCWLFCSNSEHIFSYVFPMAFEVYIFYSVKWTICYFRGRHKCSVVLIFSTFILIFELFFVIHFFSHTVINVFYSLLSHCLPVVSYYTCLSFQVEILSKK